MTCWYAFARPLAPPQVAPSSTPLYPPKDTATLPTLDRRVFTMASTVVSPDTLWLLSPFHAGVQPAESITNARLNALSPVASMALPMSCGLLSSGMKYAGARKDVFGGGDGEPVGVGEAVGDGEDVLVGDGDGDVFGVLGGAVLGLGPTAPGIEKSSA